METIQDRVRDVRLESDRLNRYLQGLPEDAWEHQSACESWTVAEVVAHLFAGAQFYTSCISRGLEGDTSPLAGFLPAGTGDPSVLGSAIAKYSVSLRQDLGEGLLAEFQSASDQLNQLLAGLSTIDWDKPCYHPIGLVPAGTFASLRMFELALHGWDIASKFQPDAEIPPEGLDMIMDIVTRACPGLVQPAVGQVTGFRYRFDLSGSHPGVYDLVVECGVTRLDRADSGPTDATLQCSADDFLLIMTGRLPLGLAIKERRLIVTGGSTVPPGFGDWFKGAWRPGKN